MRECGGAPAPTGSFGLLLVAAPKTAEKADCTVAVLSAPENVPWADCF
jgi:hypothetical protein